MRLLVLTLFSILSLLLFSLVAGKNGVMDYTQIQKEVTVQSQNNALLRERNQALKNEIKDLRQGYDAIEERSRNELGMIKKNETFYRIITEDN